MSQPTEITDPVEAEVVQLIRSAQGSVTQAVQLLVGSLRLQKQMNGLYRNLEVALVRPESSGQEVADCLLAINKFRADILARANANQVSNSPADSPGA